MKPPCNFPVSPICLICRSLLFMVLSSATCLSCSPNKNPSQQPAGAVAEDHIMTRDGSRYNAGRPAVFPSSLSIAFGSAFATEGDIYFCSSDGMNLMRLTSGPSSKGWPAVSPDGKKLAYCVHDGDSDCWHVWTMSRNGQAPLQLTHGDASSDTAPSYSPDGSNIIFVRARRHRPYSMGGFIWDHCDLWLMRSDGSDQRQLTQSAYYSVDPPYFFSDESRIIFGASPAVIAGASLMNSIFICDIDQRNRVINLRRIQSGTYDGQPSLSPDNSKMTFMSRRVSRQDIYDYEIWVSNIDGTGAKQVTNNRSLDTYPAFARDGNSIYCLSDQQRNGDNSLCVVRADGTGFRRIFSVHSANP